MLRGLSNFITEDFLSRRVEWFLRPNRTCHPGSFRCCWVEGGERVVKGEIEVRGPRSSYSPTIRQGNSLIVVIDVTIHHVIQSY